VITEVTDAIQEVNGVLNPVYIEGYFQNVNQPLWQALADEYIAITPPLS